MSACMYYQAVRSFLYLQSMMAAASRPSYCWHFPVSARLTHAAEIIAADDPSASKAASSVLLELCDLMMAAAWRALFHSAGEAGRRCRALKSALLARDKAARGSNGILEMASKGAFDSRKCEDFRVCFSVDAIIRNLLAHAGAARH